MRRLFMFLLAGLLLAMPVSALGQSQVLLRATEQDETGACRDVSLGSYGADTMRLAAGTDIALLPTGALGLNLQTGPVDDEALALSFPEDEMICTITLTAPQLKELLEQSAAPLSLNEEEGLDREASQWDGFLQLSGLHVIYDVSALAGRKVYEVKLDSAEEIDLSDESRTFTAAVPVSLLDGTYGYPLREAEGEVGLLRELLSQRIAAEGITAQPDEDRIILYGAHENNIIDAFPPMLVVVVVLLFAFFGGHKWRRSVNFER